MEDIPDLYEMPYTPTVPVVCMDEKPYRLLGETKKPLPLRPSDTQKMDSEYVRNGTCSIVVFLEPLSGVRHVSAREHRTAVDWAEEIRYLVNVSYPDRDKIILVMDNLNTHALSSLYKAFPAPEARRIAKKLEIHYTPKHGSWLNIAEIELNVRTSISIIAVRTNMMICHIGKFFYHLIKGFLRFELISHCCYNFIMARHRDRHLKAQQFILPCKRFNYWDLMDEVNPWILKKLLQQFVTKIYVERGTVSSVTFKNDLTLRFIIINPIKNFTDLLTNLSKLKKRQPYPIGRGCRY